MTDSPSKQRSAQSFDSRPTPAGPSIDALFDALADPRRRYVLQCLSESRRPMALADLAAEVAARETERPIPDVPVEEVERVYLSLSHSHLPRLADANVVEYTEERNLLALSEAGERAESFLEVAAESEW